MVGIELRPKLLSLHPMELFSGREIKGTTFGDYKGKSQIASLVDMYMNKVSTLESSTQPELDDK